MSKVRFLFSFLAIFGLVICDLFSLEDKDSQVALYTDIQQKLMIKADDVKLIPEEDKSIGGYHLYIRKLPDVESVLLTETTKDPNGKIDNYAYRANDYNKINGDEIRLLDGEPLTSDSSKYSLVDSTVEDTDFFGPAFHIYIPFKIYYGYPWTRNGEVKIKKGTFVNIRSFDKPFADYTGNYMDSPFMFDVIMKKKEPEPVVFEDIITDDYNHIASVMFSEISEDISYSKGPETIVEDIIDVFKREKQKTNLDIVFAIDATGSMKNDINKLKADLLPALKKFFGNNSNVRFGLLFYRDYGDTFNYNKLPVMFFDFTTDFDVFSKNLNSIKITGLEGGDIPEAVYEAIYASTMFYNWRPDANKEIILIGDAEPHPTPRGTKKYSRDYVLSLAKYMGVKIKTILLPKN